ncbi:STAS domain-containing protein [Kribbella qitaiheensis]|uniref:STAS domain-containing protein n=1 Tax=Kribbella qitaiheensis TaxID=1544730 RepID=A0A7G6WSI1_9ACTN|nr:hypothetical protein [Kribbella qitaiheensis]QNE16946.1 STAS domain-containing protein [Kribbella qitaiheensis]
MTIVAPVGLLSVSTAPQLRDALLKCLADQPQAVLVDLARLQVGQVHTLSIFAVVARQAALWSGVPLLLVAAPEMEQRLRSRSLERYLRIASTLAEAMTAARDLPLRRLTLRVLPHDLQSAPAGRRQVRQTCTTWDCANLTQDATAVSEELVSNALRYTGGDLIHRLELRRGLLTVAVTDLAPEPPMQLETIPNQPSTNGFGLRIVTALSASWGWSPTTTGGKTVWAVLR